MEPTNALITVRMLFCALGKCTLVHDISKALCETITTVAMAGL